MQYNSLPSLALGFLVGVLVSWLMHWLLCRQSRDSNDQLEAIEGIGPEIAKVLRTKHIHRFAQVASLTAPQLKSMLDAEGSRFQLANPETWPEQAKLLSEGDILAFMALIERLRGGVPRASGR